VGRAYLIFLLLGNGLLLAACALNGRPPSIPGQYFATVDARKGWQDSGVTLAAGDKVTISYSSGQWTHFPKEVPPFSGGMPPDDYTYICAEGLPASDCVEPVPDFQAGALIGYEKPLLVASRGFYGTILNKQRGHSLPSLFVQFS
jgi:hypothetical protein